MTTTTTAAHAECIDQMNGLAAMLPEACELQTFALGPSYPELRRALGLAVPE